MRVLDLCLTLLSAPDSHALQRADFLEAVRVCVEALDLAGARQRRAEVTEGLGSRFVSTRLRVFALCSFCRRPGRVL